MNFALPIILFLFAVSAYTQDSFMYDQVFTDVNLRPTTPIDSDQNFSYDLKTLVEYSSLDKKIAVYNTGLILEYKNPSGFSANATTAINGPVDEIDSENFDLDNFVKELYASYEFNREEAVLLLSVGKMKVGTKTDRDSSKDIGGVMGVRLTISPNKIPFIQDWLDDHEFKIKAIEITRYNSKSKSRLQFDDLEETDMTAIALRISHSNNLHTFFIYKTPDHDSSAAQSTTVGGVYSLDAPLDPRFFALANRTKSDHVDLNILILSLNVEIFEDIRTVYTHSWAEENLYGSNKETRDLSFKKYLIGSKKGKSLQLVVGAKQVVSDDSSDVSFYMRLVGHY